MGHWGQGNRLGRDLCPVMMMCVGGWVVVVGHQSVGWGSDGGHCGRQGLHTMLCAALCDAVMVVCGHTFHTRPVGELVCDLVC